MNDDCNNPTLRNKIPSVPLFKRGIEIGDISRKGFKMAQEGKKSPCFPLYKRGIKGDWEKGIRKRGSRRLKMA